MIVAPRVEPRPAFTPGAMIGQFRVIGELGAGGMGVVLEAHDRELDRHVAIKVVRDPDAGASAGARLAAEAQAMARLAHPNVVAVHEVGTIEDQVFLVMELVRGDTLATWLEREVRPWREIVAMFLQAGEGLRAAHRAGLIHRDFKPNNVLIDDSGRARVSDFGLARGTRNEHEPRLAVGSDTTGAGTPAYMAPEQRFGDPVDARADQYAFAVSLQQALAPKHAIGRPPRRVRDAIARALAIDPDERFPVLDELLAELRKGMRSRTVVVAAIAGGIVIAGLAASLVVVRPVEDDCLDGMQLVDDVWNPFARTAQLTRFLQVRPGSMVSGTSTAKLVDEWSQRWKLGRKVACSIDGPTRREHLGCLDNSLHELRAQIALWHGADAAAVDHAVHAAASLPQPQHCALHPSVELAEPVRVRVAELSAMLRSGHAREAYQEVPALIALAEASHSPGSLAAALLLAGKLEREAGDLPRAREHLSRAAREAAAAGDDRNLLEALLFEATVIVDLGRPRDSLALLDAADALQVRARLDSGDKIALARGDALSQIGRAQDAITEIERMLPRVEERAKRDLGARLDLTVALGTLASAQKQLDPEAARRTLVRALDLDEQSFGRDHPEVGKTLHDLASTELRLERFDDVRAHLRRALAIFVASYGERHRMVGTTYMTLGNLASNTNQFDDALALYLKAREVLTGVLPDDAQHFATLEQGLGEILRFQDKCADAIPHMERAITLLVRSGHGENERALQLTNLGVCLGDVGRAQEGARALRESIAEIERLKMPSKWLAEPLAALADLEYAAGRRSDAIALATRALAELGDTRRSDADAVRDYIKDQLATWQGSGAR